MRAAGLEGVSRRRRYRVGTTTPGGEAPAAPDLVERDFTAARPDELWFADITYVPTWQGWLYLAAVVDACSRRCVGSLDVRRPASRARRGRARHTR